MEASHLLHDILKAEGMVIERKQTARIYREEGLFSGNAFVLFYRGILFDEPSPLDGHRVAFV